MTEDILCNECNRPMLIIKSIDSFVSYIDDKGTGDITYINLYQCSFDKTVAIN